jgi:hypothetical protein
MILHVRSTLLGSVVTALVLLLTWSFLSRDGAPSATNHATAAGGDESRLLALEKSVRDLQEEVRRNEESRQREGASSGVAAPTQVPQVPEVVRSPESPSDAVQPEILELLRNLWNASKDDGFGLNEVLRRSGRCPADRAVYDLYRAACDRARDAWKKSSSEQDAFRQDFNQAMAAEGADQTAEAQKAFRERHPELLQRLTKASSDFQETLKAVREELERDLEALPPASR